MCRAPSTPAETQLCVQASSAGRPDDEGPGSAPGTFGCKFLGLLERKNPWSSDCVHQGGSEFFGPLLSGTLVLGSFCDGQILNLHVEA